MKALFGLLLLTLSLSFGAVASGQIMVTQPSEFLGEYPPLEAIDEIRNSYFWRDPDAEKRYRAMKFEQPEIFLHPKSKYRGIKPDAMKLVADSLKDVIATRAAERHPVVDRTGPDVVRVRIALLDVFLDKRRAPFSWADGMGGTTVYTLRAAVGRNLSLVEARIEVEAVGSETGQRLAVMVAKVGQKKVDELDVEATPSSWLDLLWTLERLADAAQPRLGDLITN